MNRNTQIAQLLEELKGLSASHGPTMRFMEVCGSHTMSAFRSGLHSLLPPKVELLSGPGCPVCVTAQAEIDALVQLALRPGLTVCTYGDLLRVPGATGTLEQARSRGADVRVVYSALDALALARRLPEREVVFMAVGFETTAPATAAVVSKAREEQVRNFSVLASHKRVLPAMRALLEGGGVRVDGFLCPGHAAAVIGSEAYRPLVTEFGKACVIAGFEDLHMARAIVQLARLAVVGWAKLVNDYPEAVMPQGNQVACRLMDSVFSVADARWRGLGVIPQSGLVLRPELASYDAARRFGLAEMPEREVPGCICGEVITAAATPHNCKLFGRACTPVHPIGPCMVSSEGTCQAYFKYARLGGRWSGALVSAAPGGAA